MSWGMIGASAIGAGASLYASGQNKGSGTTGPSVIKFEEYPWTAPTQRSSAEFVQQNIQRMSEGKLPAYFDKVSPQIKAGMRRGLDQTYFGGQGMKGPGVMQQVRNTGAALGTGPRAVLARENKALYDYSSKAQEIDEYMAKLGVDIQSRAAVAFPQLVNNMKRGPQQQVVGGVAYGGQPDYAGDAFSDIMGAMPYLSNMKFPWQQDTTTVGTGGGYDDTFSWGSPSAPPRGYMPDMSKTAGWVNSGYVGNTSATA